MTLPQINLDADTTHLIIVGVLTFLGNELRLWRIWYMQKHGGAPDKDKA